MGQALKKEETAVATKATTEVAVDAPPAGAWGAENIDSKRDLIIPKILLMQGQSEIVKQKKAIEGDIVNSLTGEKLGNAEKDPVEIIPISMFKTWVISKREKGKLKFEYQQTLPLTAENEELAWEEEQKDGSVIRRDRTLNYYVLVAKELAEGMALPYVISFRRTSTKAGKALANHFAKMSMVKQPAAAMTVKVGGHSETNDDGTYMVYDVLPGRKSTDSEKGQAWFWYQGLAKSAHKVDESDLKAPVAGEVLQPEGEEKF